MKLRTLVLIATVPLGALRVDAQQAGWATPAPPAAPAEPAVAAMPLFGTPRAPRPAIAAQGGYAPQYDMSHAGDVNARYPQDPADSLYREARSLLNRGEWRRSATMFAQVAGRSPASSYAADALYWQAFALYRIGGVTELRDARTALDSRKSRFPRAGNQDDADALAGRVNGALARLGDAGARTAIQSTASGNAGSCDSEELSVRASALSTLMKNDPNAATPILMRILDRRDECSVSLRSNAVMILSRKDDAASRAKLLEVAQRDPAASIRADAIGYIAAANTDEVAGTLDGIIRNDTTLSVQRSAVRALGSMSNPRAKSGIRALIERTSAPERLRIEAISTFDRRAGANVGYAYSCSSGQCVDVATNLSFVTAPTPPAPAVAPTPRPAPRPIGVDEARAAAAEARATAAADARVASAEARAVAAEARAGQRPMAYTMNGDVVRWDDSDRRIAPEDATWLRGIYARLETPRLRSAAVSVLARAADEGTLNWLLGMVQREEEPAEVRSAILSRLGRDLPIAQLGRLYDGAASRTVRTEIVSVLGRREEPEATDKLIDIVRTGTDPQLRRSAISALNNKKDPRTTQLLLELIDK